jgi:hypothetical protein
MKTIKPIEIRAKQGEKILTIVNRGINNAYCNNCIVKVIIDGIECLVYPFDSFNKVATYIKVQMIARRIKELEAVTK